MTYRNSLALGLFSLLVAGCNSLGGVPEFTTGSITPPQLSPGDTGLITIEVKDKNAIVHSIVGVVKEEPTIELKLRDDGQEGDVAAADGIWSLAVTVPMDKSVPAGTFNITFTAKRKDGVPVPIRDAAGAITPLTLDLPFVVQAQS